MKTNRVQAASYGYSDMVSETPVGWVAVGFMFVVAFFLVGYLIVSRNKRAKQEQLRRANRNRNRM